MPEFEYKITGQSIGVHEAGKDDNETHLTDEPTLHKTMVQVTTGGRIEGPRVGCNLRDKLPEPVTVPV